MDPLLQGYQKSKKNRIEKEKEYMRQLRQQIDKQKQRKQKQEQRIKLQDKKQDEKRIRDLKQIEERNARTGNPKTKRSRIQNKQIEEVKVSEMKPKVDSIVLEKKQEISNFNYGESSPIGQLKKKSSLKSSAVSYTPYLQYSNIKTTLPYSSGYMKAKQQLEEQRYKITRFRNQLLTSSKKTFIRSAQSALDDLKMVTTQIKNSSQTLPFILPSVKPQLGINLQFLKPRKEQDNNNKNIQIIDKMRQLRESQISKKQAGIFGKGGFQELVLENQKQLHGVKQFKY